MRNLLYVQNIENKLCTVGIIFPFYCGTVRMYNIIYYYDGPRGPTHLFCFVYLSAEFDRKKATQRKKIK